jgi:rapamycin-insensitive companion of mTOR
VAGTTPSQSSPLDKIFLDQVTYKVQILPQKYKIIKTPVHLYGELVKTEQGAQYLKQTQDIEFFKKEILNPETPLVRKRASLWTIGHIASSEHGFKLI